MSTGKIHPFSPGKSRSKNALRLTTYRLHNLYRHSTSTSDRWDLGLVLVLRWKKALGSQLEWGESRFTHIGISGRETGELMATSERGSVSQQVDVHDVTNLGEVKPPTTSVPVLTLRIVSYSKD